MVANHLQIQKALEKEYTPLMRIMWNVYLQETKLFLENGMCLLYTNDIFTKSKKIENMHSFFTISMLDNLSYFP